MLSQFYIPCKFENNLLMFEWAGFFTNTDNMAAAGWEYKCFYNKFIKKYLLRFYHPQLFMTFGLKLDSINNLDGKVFVIDLMSIGGARNRRPIKQEFITELNESDVPVLLEAVVDLQKHARDKYIREMILPTAEVLSLKIKHNTA